jgi:hypothetical protein
MLLGCTFAELRRYRFWLGSSQPYRLTTLPPSASHSFTICSEIPRRHVMLVADDQHGAASVTMGGLASGIVDIASVDVPNACVHGDPSRHAQRLYWCRQGVHQLPVRMERSKV